MLPQSQLENTSPTEPLSKKHSSDGTNIPEQALDKAPPLPASVVSVFCIIAWLPPLALSLALGFPWAIPLFLGLIVLPARPLAERERQAAPIKWSIQLWLYLAFIITSWLGLSSWLVGADEQQVRLIGSIHALSLVTAGAALLLARWLFPQHLAR